MATSKVPVRPMLLGFTIPWRIAACCFESDTSPAIQTHKFAWSVARSLRHAFNDVWLLSACPVQNYPLNRHVIFKTFKFREFGIDGVSIGFINILVLKHVSRFISCILNLKKVLRMEVNTVFIHGVHLPFLIYGLVLRAFGVKVVAILTDQAGVILPTDGFASKALKAIDRAVVASTLGRFEFVIAVSEGLLERVADNCKVLILPGILSQEWLELVQNARQPTGKGRPRVLYAGGINEGYGVYLVLEASTLLPEIDFYIFGKAGAEFESECLRYENVYYMGFVSPDELVDEMLCADILINPRFSKEEFATKSFPSKLIEYMSSGKTVLTTRINGIPEDLKKFLHFIDDESGHGIAEAVKRILEMDVEEANTMAEAGKMAVIDGYSERRASLLIENLLRR
ncbi:glycosyltransferase family 4 protein [Mesorhizobium sp.]|uniref:glycosyltransferase family 4 protein n=1 Tax=Mesorhizobium sp. TaxID=1871066 RepID=UPI000FE48BB3|nr:glycosyltransferase family 4 protein [Mesorhizobium sp.]RWP38396.1 MAG: glycosyltransferase [Mesorhizobium sp.]